MNLQEIKKQLPNGAINEIAQRTGVSQPTVSQILNGKVESKSKSIVLKATAEYLTEYRTKEREAMQALQEAVKA